MRGTTPNHNPREIETMAAQKASILSQYNDRIKKAVEASRQKPVDRGLPGFGLPAGIRGAICELAECGFKIAEKGWKYEGKPYYYEVGVILYPHTFEDKNGTVHRIKGLHTRSLVGHTVAVCDTTDSNGKVTTLEENFDNICNRIRMLGGDDCVPEGAGGPMVEHIAEQVMNAHPRFRLSTSEGKQQLETTGPRKGQPKLNPKTGKPYDIQIWENWSKQSDDDCEIPNDSGHSTAMADNTGGPHVNGQVTQSQQVDPPDVPEVQQSAAIQTPDVPAAIDLDQLGLLADGGDKPSQEKLKQMGRDCGYDVDEPDPATDPFVLVSSWAEAVKLIRTGGPAAVQLATPETPPQVVTTPTQAGPPKKGDTVKYLRPGVDPRTKTPYVVADYEVTAVNPAEQTCSLKDVANQKFVMTADNPPKIQQIKWADLVH
jgi:hypothetical protein